MLKSKNKSNNKSRKESIKDGGEKKGGKKSQEMSRPKRRQEAGNKVIRIRSKCGEACVMYIGHIPHGFYEDQLHSFFSQFGNIRRLRLSRSKKTGFFFLPRATMMILYCNFQCAIFFDL